MANFGPLVVVANKASFTMTGRHLDLCQALRGGTIQGIYVFLKASFAYSAVSVLETCLDLFMGSQSKSWVSWIFRLHLSGFYIL